MVLVTSAYVPHLKKKLNLTLLNTSNRGLKIVAYFRGIIIEKEFSFTVISFWFMDGRQWVKIFLTICNALASFFFLFVLFFFPLDFIET